MRRSLHCKKQGGKTMENYAQYVKIKLLESIKSLESLKRMYVKHTDEDFSRTRKLTFDTMIKRKKKNFDCFSLLSSCFLHAFCFLRKE